MREAYTAPELTVVGSLNELTQSVLFQPGVDQTINLGPLNGETPTSS